LRLRPFCCLRPVAYALASCCFRLRPVVSTCSRLRLLASVSVLASVFLSVLALVALVGPAQKTNIATNHPPYPFIWLSFYLLLL
jgi:hypothetical protein